MEQNAQRELRAVDPDWTVRELMARLAKALDSDGPALTFGAISATHVPDDISVVLETTGSSGVSKAVGISASALRASAQASNTFLEAVPGNTWSLLLPLTHIAAVNVLLRAQELGTEAFDLRSHSGAYPPADFTAIVPTQLFRALNHDENLLKHLVDAQAVLVGGAHLSSDLHQRALEAGINIVTTYGMTETTGGCVYNGSPLEGVEVSITADSRIAIKGKTLAKSYIDDEKSWNSNLFDGWFHASDLGHFEDGKLVVDGRVDDVIISGGENLSLSAIENSLHSHFSDSNFSAFAVSDPQWGDALHLAVETDATLDQTAITDYLVETFGVTAKPKGFLQVANFPLIGIGKVDRKKLAEIFLGGSH
jgi:O-succinylbenzoic acid--CoA ligase